MDFKAFESFQNHALDAGLVFYYAGGFDSEVVRTLSANLKDRLEKENASGPVKRKLFSSFIEMAQNVLHYGGTATDDEGAPCRPGAIGMGQDGASYWIACGNLVPVDQIARINDKLSALRTMSIAEIKAAYREQLANDAHAERDTISKGAGLGLLTIARDSTHPIEFHFNSHPGTDGNYAYFYIKAVIRACYELV